jgi:hypothetical protein
MDITVEAIEIEALSVPDAFTPVVGFRRFGIPWPPREPEHYLVQKGQRWIPQEPTVAECRRAGSSAHARAHVRAHVRAHARAHAAPYQDCGCGLHAFMEAEEALRYYELTTMRGWVLASVIGWGRVLFDEDFWRAEKALVVAFADPKDTHIDKLEIVQERTGRWLERVAENYGVPILPLEELREYTLNYGEEYVEQHG